MEPLTGIATVATVVALVNVAKTTFNISGRWATLLAVVFGVAIAVVEHVVTATTITAPGIYGAFATGLLLGLTASGVYDVSKNMSGGTEVVAVPTEGLTPEYQPRHELFVDEQVKLG